MSRNAKGDKSSTKPMRKSDKTYTRAAEAQRQSNETGTTRTDDQTAKVAHQRHVTAFDHEARDNSRWLRRTGRL